MSLHDILNANIDDSTKIVETMRYIIWHQAEDFMKLLETNLYKKENVVNLQEGLNSLFLTGTQAIQMIKDANKL